MPRYEFQVLKEARKKYRIESSLFSINGDLIVANFSQARALAHKINSQRTSEGIGDRIVTPGQINAAGLLHEIFHFIINQYEKENSGVLDRAVNYLMTKTGGNNFEKILEKFINDFPPPDIESGNITSEEYLAGNTNGKNNREIILEELLLLDIGNINPATQNLNEIFSDNDLKNKTHYKRLIEEADNFFNTEKPFGDENLPLTQFLKKPILSNPFNLDDQINFIREKWGVYIYEKFGDRILLSKDLFAEDARFFGVGFNKSTPPVPKYETDEHYLELQKKLKSGRELSEDELNYYYAETEKFTSDIDWMPKVVMIAKNIFVWLNQLSKKYDRSISRLDQIPDEELSQLANWNFTSLWLIGVWERSSASKKIKQLTGNPEAAPSAYSLFDYVIAEELGGEPAFENFKFRAWQKGIRLASDMVPNHTGIYSKWMIEKPEYFIQTDYPPFPNYSFNGTNLSDDTRVEVRIEDKYYSREDAAVVFQRKDNLTGGIKYIYHGNDGTSMPWNDTAQLNLMNPEVRESLIQTIMHVARKFSIIRFDAAMTLTKKHYARLWYPRPGTGGAIPTRSDYSMTRSEFDNAMPDEFWREVVDRINKEIPETLLLAEAFWLMEGYFVRTLGMHRVYNSAFMHMMMKEENNKFRELIKNTLEFNPEILKRYVNFMSNPDEETAINQFGNGDKYFGVVIMMITLPGLPMFGHGQVEGLKEKYGMEYKRAYYDEIPDQNLISRHQAEIFPLLQKRYLFSQVDNFELYDFFDDHGYVNENVIVYSNFQNGERSLIIYNNTYQETSGTIGYTSPKANTDEEILTSNIVLALSINTDEKYFYTYTNHRTKLQHLIRGEDILHKGFHFHLNGFEYYALVNFSEIYDQDGSFERLYYHLSGKGVYSINAAMNELNLEPIRYAFDSLLNKKLFEEIEEYIGSEEKDTKLPDSFIERMANTVSRINSLNGININADSVVENSEENFLALKRANHFINATTKKKTCPKWFKETISKLPVESYDILIPLFIIDILYNDELRSRRMFDMLDTYNILHKYYTVQNLSEDEIYRMIYLVKSLTSQKKLHLWKTGSLIDNKNESLAIYVSDLLFGKNMTAYLNIHDYEGKTYFNKENFEELIEWIKILSIKEIFKDREIKVKDRLTRIKILNQFLNTILDKVPKSGYEVRKLKELLLNSNGKIKNQSASGGSKGKSQKQLTTL
ncbi:MAG TPA: alpha-amylase family glycosyl hydrolase [Ignavibacteriaceae bacterium]|nr:alpha-amylase family glycosyl hydrolase [Ignavibacteriaceae bacterium]